MSQVALFHSVLGVRAGITDAAARLRDAGHDVLVVDQYDGRVFDDYADATRYVEGIGFPALMARAVDAVEALADGFVAVGFSNGAGMAEHMATQRACAAVVMVAGALPISMLPAPAWPAGMPAQLHHSEGDPFHVREWTQEVLREVEAAGAAIEVFTYPGAGHLFTDPSLPDEYDGDSAALLWHRVLAFCGEHTA